MDHHLDAQFVGDRANRLEESDMVPAQLVRADIGIGGDRREEFARREAFLAARQTGDDRLRQRRLGVLVHDVKTACRRLDHVRLDQVLLPLGSYMDH